MNTGQTKNFPLKQIREVLDWTQADLAKRLNFSTGYIKAIEIGNREVTRGFAESVRDMTGVDPRSITENWPCAKDVFGEPYTRESYRKFLSQQEEHLDTEALHSFMMSLTRIMTLAARAGKSALVKNIINTALNEIISKVAMLSGIKESTGPSVLAIESLLSNLKPSSDPSIELRSQLHDLFANPALAPTNTDEKETLLEDAQRKIIEKQVKQELMGKIMAAFKDDLWVLF